MKRLVVVVAIGIAATLGGMAVKVLAGQSDPVPTLTSWVSVQQMPPSAKPWEDPLPRVITSGDVAWVHVLKHDVVIKFNHPITAILCVTTATLADNMSGGSALPPGFITLNGVNNTFEDGPAVARVVVHTYDVHGKPTPLPFQLSNTCNASLFNR